MSLSILDTTDQPITYVSLQQEENSDSTIMVIRVPCAAGQSLTADDDSDVRILARENGTADAFVDIQSSPIDLTPYADTNQDFDVKVHTNGVSGIVPTAVGVRVTYNP